jgi:hypothetical protein
VCVFRQAVAAAGLSAADPLDRAVRRDRPVDSEALRLVSLAERVVEAAGAVGVSLGAPVDQARAHLAADPAPQTVRFQICLHNLIISKYKQMAPDKIRRS